MIDKIREKRIGLGVAVDVYDEIEMAMSWYYYLEDMLDFPFNARCIDENQISPLVKGEIVEVVDMAPESKCKRDMYVEIVRNNQTIFVPLSQLKGLDVGRDTKEGVRDWHYWVERGYKFDQV